MNCPRDFQREQRIFGTGSEAGTVRAETPRKVQTHGIGEFLFAARQKHSDSLRTRVAKAPLYPVIAEIPPENGTK